MHGPLGGDEDQGAGAHRGDDLFNSQAGSDEIAVLAAGMRAEGGCPPPNPP